MKPLPALGIALALNLHLQAADGNWPQFRGPQASGVAEGYATATKWNLATGENVLWRVPVPGLAHSSPIIWGDRAYVTTAVRDGEAELKVGLYGNIESVPDEGKIQWRLLAFDKTTGKEIWNVLGLERVPRAKRHPKSTHCNSTPVTDGHRIVAIFGSEGLFCFDMNGKLVWKKDLGPMDSGYYVVPRAQWGFASSPVISGTQVIVLCDVQKDSFLASFDLADGKERWRVPRKDVPTWGTPTVVESSGRKQIVVNGWHHIAGYDFETGKEVWKLDGGGDIPVPTPIVSHDLVYLTSAHGNSRPIRAIRLDAAGDITPSDIGATNQSVVWAHARQGNYMQTPIVVGDLLYGCLDSGVLSCFEAKTGKVRYNERIGGGDQGFTASPVAADGKLYFPSEIGNVMVVAAGGDFSVLATNRMEETCMASPAISEGKLFFRTREHLVAIASKK